MLIWTLLVVVQAPSVVEYGSVNSLVDSEFIIPVEAVILVDTVVRVSSGAFVTCPWPASQGTRSALSHFIFSTWYSMWEGHLACIFLP